MFHSPVSARAGRASFGQNKGLKQRQQTALVRRCIELGVNLFDTHEGYGDSERILGEGASRRAQRLVPSRYQVVIPQ